MRLTTLARKVQQTPTKLIAFLAENNIEVDNGINSKLNEETVALVMSAYATDDIIETSLSTESSSNDSVIVAEELNEVTEVTDVVVEQEQKENQQEKEPEVEEVPVEIPTKIELPVEKKAPKIGTIEDLEEGKAEEIDLIKVKKVKLEGIKVVGKIELPEKPKKVETKEEETTDEAVATSPKHIRESKNRNPKHQNRKHLKGRRNRKPLTYEEKLKREEREKQRQIKLKLKKEKELKKAHYIQTVQAKATSAKSSKKKRKKRLDEQAKSQQVVVYKNPIKRLWAWLNGKYDKY